MSHCIAVKKRRAVQRSNAKKRAKMDAFIATCTRDGEYYVTRDGSVFFPSVFTTEDGHELHAARWIR